MIKKTNCIEERIEKKDKKTVSDTVWIEKKSTKIIINLVSVIK